MIKSLTPFGVIYQWKHFHLDGRIVRKYNVVGTFVLAPMKGEAPR
jgi:hypothetical protein